MSKATEAAEAKTLEGAKAMREAYHAERGRTDHKDWDDLAPEKQQRWLDKANGED